MAQRQPPAAGQAFEVNFDGLVGPTHNYSGLSHGNIASTGHRAQESRPRDAALQGLMKMRALHDLGLKQAVLVPHERPHVPTLRRLGFSGSDAEVVTRAAREAPLLLAACSSASAMWTANAATVAPSADTRDGRVHFTPANLVNKLHRAIEAPVTGRVLRAIFSDETVFAHHDPLPAHEALGDEGAANHTRLARDYAGRGVHFFVYGREAQGGDGVGPVKFPARQTREASLAVSRLHGLSEDAVQLAQQSPAAIDAGVFHNDVICVGNLDTLFLHEKAFRDASAIPALARAFEKVCGAELRIVTVPEREVSVEDAVRSYLFNSQLVSVRGGMLLLAPSECEATPRVKAYLDALVASGTSPIREVKYLDVRQSMNNGGGPACLRLRVVLTEKEMARAHQGVFFSEALHAKLAAWVETHYRERLAPKDLGDPALVEESRRALDALTKILGIGSVYDFQR